jgi:uncharacterized protein (DUF2267 family)
MYLGVVARPAPKFDFHGRVYLERVSKKKVITRETTHTRFTDDVVLNADLRNNGWRRLVPDGTIEVADLKELIAEEYNLDEDIADRLEFSYKTFVGGSQRKEKSVRYSDTDSIPSGTRQHVPDNNGGVQEATPVTLDDITLQVRYKLGDEIEEDISCDSDFMLKVMDRVGKALRKAFYWVRRHEEIYLVMDNAGGHGTAEAWETFTTNLETKYNIQIIRQVPRSPETNVLDLGIWLSIQAAVEKRMHMRRGDKEALANAVIETWESHLSTEAFTRVCDRLRNVLSLIAEDNGGNALVEEKRGKAFRGLDLPEQEQPEEDDEEEE